MGIIGDPNQNIGPILASTNCTFKFPLSYPDEIICAARVTELLKDRFVMEYCVFSKGNDRLAAKGSGMIVSYDYKENQKVSLPDSWKQVIAEIEKEEL